MSRGITVVSTAFVAAIVGLLWTGGALADHGQAAMSVYLDVPSTRISRQAGGLWGQIRGNNPDTGVQSEEELLSAIDVTLQTPPDVVVSLSASPMVRLLRWFSWGDAVLTEDSYSLRFNQWVPHAREWQPTGYTLILEDTPLAPPSEWGRVEVSEECSYRDIPDYPTLAHVAIRATLEPTPEFAAYQHSVAGFWTLASERPDADVVPRAEVPVPLEVSFVRECDPRYQSSSDPRWLLLRGILGGRGTLPQSQGSCRIS